MKILVVDDEPILGNTIVKALEREFDAEVLLAADDYLTKPFSLTELTARLRRLVEQA